MPNAPPEPSPGRPRKRRWRRILGLLGINLLILAVVDVILGSLLNDRLFEAPPELQWGEAERGIDARYDDHGNHQVLFLTRRCHDTIRC